MQYLLPCQCGQKLPVDASQAGLRIRCTCGAQPQVPTLRGLAALERATADAGRPAAREWGPRQATMFLGLSIVVVTMAATTVLLITYPKFPVFPSIAVERQMFEKRLADLDIEKTFEEFATMQKQMAQPGELQPIADYQQKTAAYRGYLAAMAVLAAVGAALILGPLSSRRQSTRPKDTPRAAPAKSHQSQ